MPYRYRDDYATSDAAFEAWGTTPEAMFISAAEAALHIMLADISTLRKEQEIELHIREETMEMLLFSFLDEILFHKDARQAFLLPARLSITTSPDGCALDGTAWADPITPERHTLQTDVKAVTLYRFRVENTGDCWRTTVVLDI